MTWEIKDRDGANCSSYFFMGRVRQLGSAMQLKKGQAVRDPSLRTWESFGWSLAQTCKGKPAHCVYSRCESLQSKEGSWRQCPGKVSPGQCYSLGVHQDLIVSVDLQWISAARSWPIHDFGCVL